MIRDPRFERWLEARRQAWAIQREIQDRYVFARGLRGDKASANTTVDPPIAASATTAASTSIQVLPGAVSPLWAGAGTNTGGQGGFWYPGRSVRFVMFGIGTTSTTPGSTTFQWVVDTSQSGTTGNSLGSTSVALAASLSNIAWTFEGRITCRTTGTAGTLWGQGWLALGTLASTNVVTMIPASAPATAAVDTTQASAIKFLLTLGATTVSFTVELSYWEVLN